MSLEDFGGFSDEDLSLPEEEYRTAEREDFDFPVIKPIEGAVVDHPVDHWKDIGQLHYLEDTNEVALVGRKVRDKHLFKAHKGYAISVSVLDEALPTVLTAAKDAGEIPEDAELRYFIAYEVDYRDIYCYTLDQFRDGYELDYDDKQLCVPAADAHKTWSKGLDKVIQLGKHQLVS